MTNSRQSDQSQTQRRGNGRSQGTGYVSDDRTIAVNEEIHIADLIIGREVVQEIVGSRAIVSGATGFEGE